MIYLIAAATSLLFCLAIGLLWLFMRRRQSVDIFHRLRNYNLIESGKHQDKEDIVRRFYLFIQRTAKPIADWNISKKLDFKLKQAGIPIFGAEFVVITLIISAFAATFFYIVSFNTMAVPIAVFGVPMFLAIVIRRRISKRRESFTEQLGDCLTTVSNALRAGYSFQQAMDVVAREMEPPMSSEFERVTTDVAMGVTLEEALEQMNTRVGSPDFDLVVTAVLIQREIGGNLAQILDTISYTINERIRMKREISALTAQGRFSAWVLLVLPFVVAIFCWFFNHDQMMLFVTEEIGRIAMAVALIMEIIGFIIIQKIVDIEL